VDALIAQSPRVAEIYAGLGVDGSRIRVLQLTLRHLERLTPRTISRPPRPVRFAALNGAANVEKGSEVLLGALTELQASGLDDRFTLTVFGGMPERTRARLGRFPAVELGGRYQPRELDGVLTGLDVGIVPSVWEEAYGYVGPEFLAKGIPVIGNALGGIPEYTRDGQTGWLNDGASAEGLAAIMTEIIRNPHQVCERNRWILEHRSEIIKPFDRHLEELEAVYEEIRDAAG
jgi:glycosyltransferase involved in cell wall biosynthesis